MARLLIIDDDDALRSLQRNVLEQAGHDVAEVNDGRKALDLLRTRGAELVISDLIMPDQDGIETIGAIREAWPEIKIIAMSGGGRLDPAERLTDAELLGADASLRKPFGMDELRELVARLVAPGAAHPG
jgi:DNA-binding NtrC family response regulator